jgi:hypothetical protein
LTIRRTTGALKLLSSSGRLRLVDALILENSTPDSTAGAIEATSMNSLHVMGSSLLNNTSKFGAAQQVRLVNGSAAFANSVVWGASPNAAFYKAAGVNLSANYSLVKGMTLGGTGNLPGTVDPLLRLDARVLSSSPLRAAGGLVATSLQDIDLEARPNPPDIGADQWRVADSDGLPDGWELLYSTSLATLSGGDADADGLADLAEYAWFDGKLGANPLNPDTDGDQVRDGDEVLFGTSPLVCDSDDLGATPTTTASLTPSGSSSATSPTTVMMTGTQSRTPTSSCSARTPGRTRTVMALPTTWMRSRTIRCAAPWVRTSQIPRRPSSP